MLNRVRTAESALTMTHVMTVTTKVSAPRGRATAMKSVHGNAGDGAGVGQDGSRVASEAGMSITIWVIPQI